MGKIIFILGGVKSGKTSYAINQAIQEGGSVTYLACGKPSDKEMKRKIEEHKKCVRNLGKLLKNHQIFFWQ